jgi:5-methylcytosine-specific restriction endonuclease McrA
MSDLVNMIEHMSETLTQCAPCPGTVPADTSDTMAMPMERLEARICELAGHLTAATCQFLLLVADFDARGGWADWQMPSCAAWLSWKCQIAPGTAREQVRVARALAGFPLLSAEFAAGRMSYAKVRALTRIATPDTEAGLAQMAVPMTASQLERFARAHRRVSRAQGEQARAARKLSWNLVDDAAYQVRAHFPAEDWAVVLQALRAARDDLEHPHDGHGHGDGAGFHGHAAPPARMETARDLADALVQVCAAYLGDKAAHAGNPDTYQVIIHAGAEAITGAAEDTAEPAGGVSAETPALPPSHPACPARCHIEDGPAISPATLRLIACNATITTMVHGAGATVLAAGRRTRKPSAALRRAVRERDGYRCRYPGCQSRRTDAHHITYWSNGGHTTLTNLISLCKRHHALVHDKNITITTGSSGFTFSTREGIPLPASPPLPQPAGDITTTHNAAITPSTIIPPHSGERLDLNLAIWIAFANARIDAERRHNETGRQAATQVEVARVTRAAA